MSLPRICADERTIKLIRFHPQDNPRWSAVGLFQAISRFVLPAVVVSAMAARASIFQCVTGILRLAAMVAVFAFRIAQLVLCLVDALFALPVIAIFCLGWNGPRNKQRYDKCSSEQLASK
jgi:hypothetical protein